MSRKLTELPAVPSVGPDDLLYVVKLNGQAASSGIRVGDLPGAGGDVDGGTPAAPGDVIQIRRGSWASEVLADGEVGYDPATGTLRIGDGVHTWDELESIGDPSTTQLCTLTPDGNGHAELTLGCEYFIDVVNAPIAQLLDPPLPPVDRVGYVTVEWSYNANTVFPTAWQWATPTPSQLPGGRTLIVVRYRGATDPPLAAVITPRLYVPVTGIGVVQSIVPGSGVTVDNTDLANPVVSATGGGGLPDASGDADRPLVTDGAGDVKFLDETVVTSTDPRLTDARTPTAHTHTSGDVTGLDSALAGKADDDDPRLSDARTPTAHTHAPSDVTGLAPVAVSGDYDDLTGAPPGVPDSSGAAPGDVLALDSGLDPEWVPAPSGGGGGGGWGPWIPGSSSIVSTRTNGVEVAALWGWTAVPIVGSTPEPVTIDQIDPGHTPAANTPLAVTWYNELTNASGPALLLVSSAGLVQALDLSGTLTDTDDVHLLLGAARWWLPGSSGGGGGGVQSIVPGAGVTVDAADPEHPVVSATGGGGGWGPWVPGSSPVVGTRTDGVEAEAVWGGPAHPIVGSTPGPVVIDQIDPAHAPGAEAAILAVWYHYSTDAYGPAFLLVETGGAVRAGDLSGTLTDTDDVHLILGPARWRLSEW